MIDKRFQGKVIAAMRDYMAGDESQERCGLVVEFGDSQRFIPCKNSHSNPEFNFSIDQKDFIKSSMLGDIIAVCHSHTKSGMKNLSLHDRHCQYHEQIVWILFCHNDKGFDVSFHEPVKKMKGREFSEGYTDCYDSFRDFYIMAGKEMGKYGPEDGFRIPDWHKKPDAESPFLMFIEKEGFKRVLNIKELEPGDVILSLLGAKVPNHASIYVGNNMIFHHLPGKLSMVEPLRDFYIKYSHSFWRYGDRDNIRIEAAINILNEGF